jgi:hypothetical protein
MTRRRRIIPQRKPIFLGCEGESEQAYGQLLNELAQMRELAIHIEVVNLSPGTGDPHSRILRAAKEIERRSVRRSNFTVKAVLLDSDQIQNSAQRKRDAESTADQAGIQVIWQEPCHEALLLRHLNGCSTRRPPNSAAALSALSSEWAQYQKPMTKNLLSRRIGFQEVLQASLVEPLLAKFLRQINLA